MHDLCRASWPHPRRCAFHHGGKLCMKYETFASRRRHGLNGIPVLFLVCTVLLAEAASAQTIRVDTTPGRAIRFDPDRALGSSMDILPASLVDTVYSEPIL